jgi:type I restriction enzyme, R subunit
MVAHLLLERLKALLVLGGRENVQARARMKQAIAEALDGGLPKAYDRKLFQGKCGLLFEHVYENYYGEGQGTYTATA